MRQSLIVLVAIWFAVIPLSAHARQVTSWDFTGSQIPGRWEIIGLTTPQATPDGLRIHTQTEGHMRRDTELTHRADAVAITFTNEIEAEAKFLWHERGTPEHHLIEYPFILPQARTPQTITLGVGMHRNQWDPRTDKIGLVLPAGARTTVRDISLIRLNPVEKAVYASQNFWRFDAFRAHSINFLWGPRLFGRPLDQALFYADKPPFPRSANWIYYSALAVGILILWGTARRQQQSINAARVMMLLAAVWIAFDVRMGAEFLSYLRTDMQTYFGEQVGTRTYRGWGNFTELVLSVQSYVDDRDRYVLLTDQDYPAKVMAYHTYPSRPVNRSEADETIDTWVVFSNDSADVNGSGQLVLDGEPLTRPGQVIQRLNTTSFIFRTNP